jgi:TM2 domain-containing membrane protein YozV
METIVADLSNYSMARYDIEKKSAGVAYLLFAFFGLIGVHSFYLGHKGTGWLYVIMFILAFATFGATLIVSFVMSIIDVFSIPGYVRERNEAILEKISLAASN